MWRPDFKGKATRNPSDDVYDLEYDRVLIEQSIAKQYGVLPSEQGDLIYSDWAKMVAGLMDDTPLGKIIRIRNETDPDVLRNYTPEMRQMRNDWILFRQSRFRRSENNGSKQELEELKNTLKRIFGGKSVVKSNGTDSRNN